MISNFVGMLMMLKMQLGVGGLLVCLDLRGMSCLLHSGHVLDANILVLIPLEIL